MSRATKVSSALAGRPRSPMRVATQPSCMWPSCTSAGSSQCCAMGRPKVIEYSSAWRIRLGSATASPSSESATTPAPASSPAAASSLPARPRVMQPTGSTRMQAEVSASRSTDSTAARLSGGGTVLGIAQTVVKPPRAAAAVPVAIVSLYSKPGSRRWVCRSTNPGATINPCAVDAVGVDDGAALVRSDARDSAVDHHHVGDAVAAERGVDHAGVVDRERAHDAASGSVSPSPGPASRPESR